MATLSAIITINTTFQNQINAEIKMIIINKKHLVHNRGSMAIEK